MEYKIQCANVLIKCNLFDVLTRELNVFPEALSASSLPFLKKNPASFETGPYILIRKYYSKPLGNRFANQRSSFA